MTGLRWLVLLCATTTMLVAQDKAKDEQWGKIENELMSGRAYTLVLLKTGPAKDLDSATASRTQRDHLIHLFSLRDAGKLSIFGPLADQTDLRGIAIFSSADLQEVESYLKNDPWIKIGGLVYEIHPWFSLPGQHLPK